MKKIFLTLVLSVIGFIGFSNGYELDQNVSLGFNETVSIPSGVTSFSCTSNGGSTYITYVQSWNGSQQGITKTCPYTYDIDSIFKDFVVYGKNFDSSVNISFKSNTNILEFSQLGILFSPIIIGISTVVGEFIPYVIYIGLGVLIVSIAFVAVKRLMLRIYNKVRFIFKKR